MQNKKFAVAAIVVLLALGASTYVFMTFQKERVASEPVAVPSGDGSVSGIRSASLKELLTQNDSIRCTFSDEFDATKATGTVYVAGGKMRADVVSADVDTVGHIVIVDNTAYAWASNTNQGIKLTLQDGNFPTTTASGLDPEKKVDYNCGMWFPDSNTFALPSDVTFMDASAMMPSASAQTTTNVNTVPSNGDIEAPQCLACNNLPAGPARDQCRTSLNCQ